MNIQDRINTQKIQLNNMIIIRTAMLKRSVPQNQINRVEVEIARFNFNLNNLYKEMFNN